MADNDFGGSIEASGSMGGIGGGNASGSDGLAAGSGEGGGSSGGSPDSMGMSFSAADFLGPNHGASDPLGVMAGTGVATFVGSATLALTGNPWIAGGATLAALATTNPAVRDALAPGFAALVHDPVSVQLGGIYATGSAPLDVGSGSGLNDGTVVPQIEFAGQQ